MTTKRLIIIAFAIAITVVQEELLVLVPNFQFTILLIVLFTRFFDYKESFIYIFVYVFIDSMYMGALNPFYMTPMILGWMLIPTAQKLFLHKTENIYHIALFGLAFGFMYSWMFIPFKMIEQGISVAWPYFLSDLPFELALAGTGFITILWLYTPLEKVLNQLFSDAGYKQTNKTKSLPIK